MRGKDRVWVIFFDVFSVYVCLVGFVGGCSLGRFFSVFGNIVFGYVVCIYLILGWVRFLGEFLEFRCSSWFYFFYFYLLGVFV